MLSSHLIRISEKMTLRTPLMSHHHASTSSLSCKKPIHTNPISNYIPQVGGRAFLLINWAFWHERQRKPNWSILNGCSAPEMTSHCVTARIHWRRHSDKNPPTPKREEVRFTLGKKALNKNFSHISNENSTCWYSKETHTKNPILHNPICGNPSTAKPL